MPPTLTSPPEVRLIGALRGASGRALQQLMWAYVVRRQADGLRVRGVLERYEGDGSDEDPVTLVDVASGAEFPVFQSVDQARTGCQLDPDGILAACAAVCTALEDGADLLVLSKFGKLEADRSGLCDAFGSAVARGIPVLTSVAPAYLEAWTGFSAELAVPLAPTWEALDSWWQARFAG